MVHVLPEDTVLRDLRNAQIALRDCIREVQVREDVTVAMLAITSLTGVNQAVHTSVQQVNIVSEELPHVLHVWQVSMGQMLLLAAAIVAQWASISFIAALAIA